MPTTRQRRRRDRGSGASVELDEHLESGPAPSVHLIGEREACPYCRGELLDLRGAWEARRERIVAEWQRFGFPCWGQCVYDDAVLPDRRDWSDWSPYATVRDALQGTSDADE